MSWQPLYPPTPCCKVTVVSTGVGASGAAVAFEEAIMAGAKTLIRVGTTGSLQDVVKTGDLIVATAAVRNDGVGDQLLPVEFPAVADLTVSGSLIEAARARQASDGEYDPHREAVRRAVSEEIDIALEAVRRLAEPGDG